MTSSVVIRGSAARVAGLISLACGLPAGLVGVWTAVATPAVAQFPAEVRGRVVDARSRAPLAGARIEFIGREGIVTTDAKGDFVLRGLSAGAWELQAAAIGYYPERRSIAVEDGVSTSVTLALSPAVALPVRLADLTARTDAPADAATVLDRAAVERAQARDLGDLLTGAAGLTVTRYGGSGSRATLSVRGSSASEVLVLVDGVPLNDPVSGEADLSTVHPESVERIVVLRGAQAARYGAQALAGAVLVETRRSGARAADLTLAAEAGAWGERRTHGTGGWRAGTTTILSARASGGYARTTGNFPFAVPQVRGGGEATRVNADSRRADALLTAALDTRGWSVRARTDGDDVDRGMPGSVVQPSRSAREMRNRLGGTVQLARSGGAFEHRLDLSLQRQRVRYADSAPPFGPAYDDSLWARTLSLAPATSARLGRVTLSAGGEFRQLDLRTTTLTDGPARRRLLGLWNQTRAGGRLGRGYWELALGARVDRDDLAHQTYVSPRLGATVGRGRASLHLSWGQAFSPATLADQFFQEGVRARANPDLRAERVRGELEGGVTATGVRVWGARLDAALTAFRADVDGMILWFPDYQFVWSPDNYDVQRRGVELTSTLRFPKPGIELNGSIGDVAATYAGPVLRGQVVYRPRFTAQGSVRAAVASVEILTRYRHTGARRTVAGSALNTLPAFGLLDVQLRRPFPVGPWGVEVTTAVENLFGRDAAMLVDYPLPGRTWRLGVQLTRGD